MNEFQTALDSAYRDANDRETLARQIEAEISKIPGAKGLLPSRRYGEQVSAEKVRANLTLRALIESNSPQLAIFFGLDGGVAHRREELREAQLLQRRSMEMRTAQLRERNAAAQRQREQAKASTTPWWHRR